MKKLHIILSTLIFFFSYGCNSETMNDIQEPIYVPPFVPMVQSPVKYPIIAHRGSWYKNGHPQNSMAALKEALALDIFGSECDIWKTKDGVLVVNHDETYHGLNISLSTYKQLAQFPLANGETLPTLDDFLIELGNSPTSTKLVIELKSNVTVDAVLDAVNQRGLIEKVIFITYSYSKCKSFAKKGYGNITYFVGHSHTPDEVKKDGIGGFYFSEENMTNEGKEDWVNWARNISIQLVFGSVTSPKVMLKYIDQGCLFSSNNPVALVKAIDTQENKAKDKKESKKESKRVNKKDKKNKVKSRKGLKRINKKPSVNFLTPMTK